MTSSGISSAISGSAISLSTESKPLNVELISSWAGSSYCEFNSLFSEISDAERLSADWISSLTLETVEVFSVSV